MKLKFLIDEDFVNYKEPSMFIGFPNCTFKCDIDSGKQVCQNHSVCQMETIDIDVDAIVDRYIKNDITKAIVIAGLEPFDSPFDLEILVDSFRRKYSIDDTIIIYTGYSKEELLGIQSKKYDGVNFDRLNAVFKQIISYGNIIIKFGRYIPDSQKIKDDVLGVELSSVNQHAELFI